MIVSMKYYLLTRFFYKSFLAQFDCDMAKFHTLLIIFLVDQCHRHGQQPLPWFTEEVCYGVTGKTGNSSPVQAHCA